MPKSDTWPGGIGLETMSGMDSAGSCDSVVSANSGFSDDSLEHLSAEEKACLMFLEETIESLDTEEDSGLSNDEPDQMPSPGNLAIKLADLSASMSKSKLNDLQKHPSREYIKENADTKPLQSHLVPTPLVMAGGTLCSVSSTKPGVPPDENLSKPQIAPPSNKSHQKPNQKPVVHFEVNVVIPPPTKPKENSVRTAEGPLPRGPLSYDALVYLQRSASTKKTPLCPTVDHTIESDKHPPALMEGPKFGNMPRSDQSHREFSKPNSIPPVVPPKPKNIPAGIFAKTQNGASTIPNSSDSIKHAKDAQVVRQKALQKLGLLNDEEQENETLAPLPPPKSHPFLDPTPKRFTNAPRSPSFSYSQVPKNKPLQSSASFHHHSRSDHQSASASHPVQPKVLKTDVLEDQRKGGNFPERGHITGAEPVKTTSAARPQKPSNSVGYSVMVVPGMGADRREALRKLGLLKH
ncbi:specifically androgen-regulated gene protein [Paralichthys olivaceus]|uniref:specifically androgen-regulated gene protein n=1 Tax=Paralichthys olivaceus TaxID=8255 RepID=UPI00097DFB62|nr:PREDICTED: specifically androgen-regulated gene protein-like [Paralichthys olivaceus]